MNPAGITDLEELALMVRDRHSKTYIVEAINAYRGGAYRSAVISTWIAISYDVISKIRELDSLGDKQAAVFVNELDNAIRSNDLSKFLKIEGGLLEKARDDYELVSPHEFTDLERVKIDRHFCAHPAFAAEGELFSPRPELVRAHLVHAVLHLLRHQPVQGRAALIRIMEDISSSTFPQDYERVQVVLQEKYLNRCKDSLVRNLIGAVLAQLMKIPDPPFYNREQSLVQTLVAVSKTHNVVFEGFLKDNLSRSVLSASEQMLGGVFEIVEACPAAWTFLSAPARIRAIELLRTTDLLSPFGIAVLGIDVPEVRSEVHAVFDKLDQENKLAVIQSKPSAIFIPDALELLRTANSFRQAETLFRRAVSPLAAFYCATDIANILDIALINVDINNAGRIPSHLETLFVNTLDRLAETHEAWINYIRNMTIKEGLDDDYYACPKIRQRLISAGYLL